MKIKTGDKVRVITGKDKGKEGKVLQTFPALLKIVVEGVNVQTKYVRGRGKQKGQKITFSAPLHLSNVRVIGPSGQPGRLGSIILKKDSQKIKTRVLRRRGQTENLE